MIVWIRKIGVDGTAVIILVRRTGGAEPLAVVVVTSCKVVTSVIVMGMGSGMIRCLIRSISVFAAGNLYQHFVVFGSINKTILILGEYGNAFITIFRVLLDIIGFSFDAVKDIPGSQVHGFRRTVNICFFLVIASDGCHIGISFRMFFQIAGNRRFLPKQCTDKGNAKNQPKQDQKNFSNRRFFLFF